MNDIKMEAAIIFDSHLPDALRRALEYAANDGFVASMPQLLCARVSASYDNIIWNTWFTSNSEESVVKTPEGNTAMVTVHGGGIFSSPERFKKLYHSSVDRSCKTGFTGKFAAKITESEASDVHQGKLPDGTEIPVFSFDEFKRGIADLPRRYAVVMGFDTAKKSKNGYQAFDDLKDDPLMIVRAGGVEAAAAYLDKAKNRGNSTTTGNWHAFNELDPDQTQTCVTLLYGSLNGVAAKCNDHLRGVDSEFGLRGDAGMINLGRYIAVAPRNVSASVRNLPFRL